MCPVRIGVPNVQRVPGCVPPPPPMLRCPPVSSEDWGPLPCVQSVLGCPPVSRCPPMSHGCRGVPSHTPNHFWGPLTPSGVWGLTRPLPSDGAELGVGGVGSGLGGLGGVGGGRDPRETPARVPSPAQRPRQGQSSLGVTETPNPSIFNGITHKFHLWVWIKLLTLRVPLCVSVLQPRKAGKEEER